MLPFVVVLCLLAFALWVPCSTKPQTVLKQHRLSRQPSHLGLRGITTSCNLIGLVHPEYVQKPVLNGEEVEKHVVELPGDQASASSGHRIQNKVVGSCDNGRKNDGRVNHAGENGDKSLPPEAALSSQGNGGNREADEERVSEVQGGHGS